LYPADEPCSVADTKTVRSLIKMHLMILCAERRSSVVFI